MNFQSMVRAAACVLACMVMVACSGGSGGGGTSVVTDPGTTPPPPSAGAAAAQGFWSGQVDAQTTASAVYLPEGVAWTVVQDVTGVTSMARGSVTVDASAFSVTGRSFELASGTTSTFSITGTVAQKATLSVAAAGTVPSYTLVYRSAYETPATLADVVGAWTSTREGSIVRLTLNVAASGALAGSSTTGCSYTGTLAPYSAGVAVFSLSLTETCLGLAALEFTGIATLNAAKTALSAAFTTADLNAGSVILATRSTP